MVDRAGTLIDSMDRGNIWISTPNPKTDKVWKGNGPPVPIMPIDSSAASPAAVGSADAECS
jgi:hypothetical protein